LQWSGMPILIELTGVKTPIERLLDDRLVRIRASLRLRSFLYARIARTRVGISEEKNGEAAV
jgi:hypothetical protein